MLDPLRPFMGYVSLGLLIAAGIFFALYKMEKRHADKLEARNAGLVAELKRISTAKDEQREETGKNIADAKERIVYVDRIVREIENRPLRGNCETPDLNEWRNIL